MMPIGAIDVRCPKCGSSGGTKCMRRARNRWVTVPLYHQARQALARLRQAELEAWAGLTSKDRRTLKRFGIGATT